jgi:acyl-CoA synthetase (AMP-forming)/AMP-acid ligase II
VKEEGCEFSANEVLAHCRSHMPYSKAPKVVVFGSEIPLTTTGKYQRLKLKGLFADYRSMQFKEGR